MKVITDIYIFKTSDDIRIYKALIIGMDVIQHGLFILNKGQFSFTIEQLK